MNGETGLLAVYFVCVLLGILIAGHVALRRLGRQRAAPGAPGGRLLIEDAPLPSTQALLARVFRHLGASVPGAGRAGEPERRLLLAAGYRWPAAPTAFQGIRIAAALAFAGIAGWTLLLTQREVSSAVLPVVWAGAFGYLLPRRILAGRMRRRAGRIRSGIPPAIDLLVLALEAGQSLDQAMQEVARALARLFPDLSDELLFCRLEMRAGKSREEALLHLAGRSAEPELSKLATLLLDGDRYGASLGPALRSHARCLRTRVRHQAQEKARKLGVKLTFPVFFLIFPSLLLVTLGPALLQLRASLRVLFSSL